MSKCERCGYDDQGTGSAHVCATSPQYTIAAINIPKPVGYWVLYPGAPMAHNFGVYQRPTDMQIKNTESLLGWGWVDAHE